ncbi:hypothetical protein [Vibrio agarivorans]|uniref:hypothetical protein n=1 Tax=Vibrio agarivorans TaxID=153622 RepID=UPI002230A62B|nr:hypothetical protein [Vibrio agarivorans]
MTLTKATPAELELASKIFEDFISNMPELSLNTLHKGAPSGININDNEEVVAYLTYAFSQYLESIESVQQEEEIPESNHTPHTKLLLTLDESGYPVSAISNGSSELEILIWDSDYDGIVDHVLPMPNGNCGVLTNLFASTNPDEIEWASAIFDLNLNNYRFEDTTISLLSEDEIKIEQKGTQPITEIIHCPAENAINMLHALKQEFKYLHGYY